MDAYTGGVQRTSRRRLVQGVSALTLAQVTVWPRVARAEAAKVLIVGDSMIAGAFGLFLERAVREREGAEAVRSGRPSTGLARPDFFDWHTKVDELVKAESPQTVVCMFGGNDGQGLYMGRKSDPKWIRYPETRAWTAEYARRIDAFADAAMSGGASLGWVGMPIVGPEGMAAKMRWINTIYRARMAVRPRARFLDVWSVLADENGAYRQKITIDGSRKRLRGDDGVHLSVLGARLLVEDVLPSVLDLAGVPGAQPSVE